MVWTTVGQTLQCQGCRLLVFTLNEQHGSNTCILIRHNNNVVIHVFWSRKAVSTCRWSELLLDRHSRARDAVSWYLLWMNNMVVIHVFWSRKAVSTCRWSELLLDRHSSAREAVSWYLLWMNNMVVIYVFWSRKAVSKSWPWPWPLTVLRKISFFSYNEQILWWVLHQKRFQR